MKTIDSIFTNEIVIKNSRFITILFPLYEDNILEFVNKVKADYPKATHYCYAYVTEKHQKASDDGEPGGTAGLPMLNVLLKEEMLNVLAVTVRYFGGIKLGAGGLVRAYTKSVKEAIDNTSIIPVEKGYRISIKVMYNEQKSLDYILKDVEVLNKQFDEVVTYTLLIAKEKINILNNYDYTILNEEYIKRN